MTTTKDIHFLGNRSPRHAPTINSDLSGVIDLSQFVEFSGVEDKEVMPHESWHLLSSCEPVVVTKFAGKLWEFIAANGVKQLAPKPKANLEKVLRLPLELRSAFAELIGSTSVVVHSNHDWERLRSHAILLGSSKLLNKGFKDYAEKNHGSQEVGMAMMGLFGGAVAQLPEKIRLFSSQNLLTAEGLWLLGNQVTALESHLDAVCDIAAGRVLCDADQLVLHYRGNGPLCDAELCLSYRASDGLLSFFPSASTNYLRVSAVRSIRDFVKRYIGPTIAGEISPHPRAMRLCELCGLDISHGHGFLRSQKRSSSTARGFAIKSNEHL